MKVDLIGNLLAIKPPLAITSETILILFNCLIFFSKASEGICNKIQTRCLKTCVAVTLSLIPFLATIFQI